jgi:dihydropteroate synthase
MRANGLSLRGRDLHWGSRTFLIGILNVTPDSFSGDGLAARPDPIAAAVAQALRMAEEGADILDIGGESTRPGHVVVDADEEEGRVMPVVRAVREALPRMPLSIDTRKVVVAERALVAGADVLNDVSGVTGDGALARLAAERDVPVILMHDRTVAATDDQPMTAVIADLAAATERALRLGCREDQLVLDPGFGFGKTAIQNLALLRDLAALCGLGLPVLLGTSRKSTIGRVLGLPPAQRVEGTLATTALGIAAGIDLVRVHDVAANLRVARMADAIVRGWQEPGTGPGQGGEAGTGG